MELVKEVANQAKGDNHINIEDVVLNSKGAGDTQNDHNTAEDLPLHTQNSGGE